MAHNLHNAFVQTACAAIYNVHSAQTTDNAHCIGSRPIVAQATMRGRDNEKGVTLVLNNEPWFRSQVHAKRHPSHIN
eukprot:6310822-Amphidinium_carterae.1